jgi:hypothetical protein
VTSLKTKEQKTQRYITQQDTNARFDAINEIYTKMWVCEVIGRYHQMPAREVGGAELSRGEI